MPPENDEEQPSEDPMIFCFVCGHLRPSKTLIEHIDKCYRRVEAETSLTSIFETKVEGSKRLFCDAYNNNTKAFCKRLKVNIKCHLETSSLWRHRDRIPIIGICSMTLQKRTFLSGIWVNRVSTKNFRWCVLNIPKIQSRTIMKFVAVRWTLKLFTKWI